MESKIHQCFLEIEEGVLQYFSSINRSERGLKLKTKKDAVTEHDTAIERLIRELVHRHFPDHNILGEECGDAQKQSQHVWHIDPIDNTVGFRSGEQEFSTSVALKNGDTHISSLVINPVSGEIFKAIGDKSYKNDQIISPFAGNLKENSRGISTCAFVNSANIPRIQGIFAKIFLEKFPIRISGGAALDLCRIAEGVRMAHISLGAHSWDIEAGIHIVRSAGGIVEILTEFPERNSKAFLASANQGIHNELKRIFGEFLQFHL